MKTIIFIKNPDKIKKGVESIYQSSGTKKSIGTKFSWDYPFKELHLCTIFLCMDYFFTKCCMAPNFGWLVKRYAIFGQRYAAQPWTYCDTIVLKFCVLVLRYAGHTDCISNGHTLNDHTSKRPFLERTYVERPRSGHSMSQTLSRGDIFRVQTRRVSLTIVFRDRGMGGR
jgi:hypothetical protein